MKRPKRFESFRPSQEVEPEEAFCSDNTHIPESLPLEKQYLAAECLGKSEGDCRSAYPDCPQSPLDFISEEFNVDWTVESVQILQSAVSPASTFKHTSNFHTAYLYFFYDSHNERLLTTQKIADCF